MEGHTGMEKEYVAVVRGVPRMQSGTLRGVISKSVARKRYDLGGEVG